MQKTSVFADFYCLPNKLALMGPAPSNALPTWAKRLRPRARVLAHEVKAFEESVFGPCTLGRTWGTRPGKRALLFAQGQGCSLVHRKRSFCISNSPQKRHPERSAPQIYRVTQRLVARSRRTPRVLILPMPFGAFQPLKPAPDGPATIFPWGRQQGLLASYVRLLHLHSRQPYRHAFHWRHQQPLARS